MRPALRHTLAALALLTAPLAAQEAGRLRLFLAPFDPNGTIGRGDLQKFHEELRQRLIESARYDPVPAEEVQAAAESLGFRDPAEVPDSLDLAMAQRLGAQVLLEGHLLPGGEGELVARARLIQVQRGATASIPEVRAAGEGAIFALAERLAEVIFRQADVEKHIVFGIQYLQSQQLERARENFRRAVALDSTRADAHYYLANTHLDLRDTSAAIAEYQAALGLDSLYADPRLRLAAIAQARNRPEDALREFAPLTRLKPHDVAVGMNYALLLYQLGRTQEAIAQYERVAALDTTNAATYQSLGLAYYKAEDNARATQALERADRLKPGDVNTLIFLASAYHKMQDYPKAISAYERVVAVDPGYPGAYKNLGIFYQKVGQGSKAIEAFRTGLQRSPGSDRGEIALALGDALVKAKRFGEAVEACKAALRYDPSNRRIYVILGDAYQGWGEALEEYDTVEKYQEAIEKYTLSIEMFEKGRADTKFASYAAQNIDRSRELIGRAELLIKKKKLERGNSSAGGGSRAGG